MCESEGGNVVLIMLVWCHAVEQPSIPPSGTVLSQSLQANRKADEAYARGRGLIILVVRVGKGQGGDWDCAVDREVADPDLEAGA